MSQILPKELPQIERLFAFTSTRSLCNVTSRS